MIRTYPFLGQIALFGVLTVGFPTSGAQGAPDSGSVPVSETPAGPAGLHWPTDAGQCITSSFCEFRPDHFHSGIDISTWGQVGYRCLAVEAGEVVRARVSCGGYGRAVYLRLADGRTAVYAHLSRFAGALEDSVRAIQTRNGTAYFDIEFPPGTFPTERGDLLAYSGQSGVGVPHLHVEIRDASERPIDPLRAGLEVSDTTDPWIARLALTPLTPASSVDGRSDTVILDAHPGEEGGRIPRVLPVEGEIGLAIEVDETTDACRFRLAPARLELREGDELLYAVDYQRFAFHETGRMDFQIDARFSYDKIGRFHRLWRATGADLPFSDGEWKAEGILRAKQVRERRMWLSADAADSLVDGGLPARRSVQRDEERIRTITIVAFDAAGNRSELDVSLSFAAPPAIAAMSVRVVTVGVEPGLGDPWPEELDVHGVWLPGGRALDTVELEWSPDGGATWLDGPRVIPGPDGAFHATIAPSARVPGAGRDGLVVRARARDVLGAYGLARTVAVEAGAAPEVVPVAPILVTLGTWFELRFEESVLWQAASGGWEEWGDDEAATSRSAVLVRPWGRGLRIVLPATAGAPAIRRWAGLGSAWSGIDPWGRPRPLEFQSPMIFGPDQPAGEVVSADGRARIRPAPDSFAEPCALVLGAEPAGRPASDELRGLGPLYSLDSGHVPPNRPWTITLRPEETPEVPSRVGIFVQDGTGFRYIGGERTGSGDVWTTETRTLLGVCLLEDVKPPALGAPRLEERHGRVRLLFRADDPGSGIDCDAVEVLFDGSPIVHELDDETGDVVAYPGVSAESGSGGEFEMRATDRCGNASRRVETVRMP